MLKNMKVGTKLLAVLVAPLVVLLGLASFGVSQRLAVANSTQRVDELAQIARADANLASAIQAEAYYSSAYMASGGTKWTVEKLAQRAKTDKARADYLAAVARINPARDSEDLKTVVTAVQARLKNLDIQRTSVDGLQTETPTAIGQFSDISKTLADLNTAIAQATNDPVLSRGLSSFANLNRLTSAQANGSSYLVAAAEVGFFPATWPNPAQPVATACSNIIFGCAIYADIKNATTDVSQQTTIFNQAADAIQKQLLRNATARQDLATIQNRVIDTGTLNPDRLNPVNGVPVNAGPIRWSPRLVVDFQTGGYEALRTDGPTGVVAAAVAQSNSFKAAGDKIITTVLADASQLKTNAQRDALLFLVFAVGAIAIALIAAALVARAVTVPLRKLTNAAYALSTDKLPALVDRLRNPDESAGSLSETLTAIEISSKDEIGQLADAFNSIQHVTVEVAEEQGALLRKGIGDIFINLARRNQTLLDRQIEFIDQLETHEEDPDQLENLFKLDHLATRMRRNAESLLVLAGAEPPRRRGRPVSLADVVRVAIGEVEDFARISLQTLDEVTVGGNVAVDLAHLLSELMENATHFSPPDSTVEIVGHRGDSSYTLSVSDQGIGMSVDQLSEANNQLARPPLVGLALSRSLGFIVIGRLAARFGIVVKLTASPTGGVGAHVTLPGDLVLVDGQPMVAPGHDVTFDTSSAASASVIVVDRETDAAVEADGVAGRELELIEFDTTLAHADREDEVHAGEGERADDSTAPTADAQVAEPETPAVTEAPVAGGTAAELVADLPVDPDATTEDVPGVRSDIDADATTDTSEAAAPHAAAIDGPSDELAVDKLYEEPATYLTAVPEGDEFERGLQSLVSDQLAPGPVEGVPGSAPSEPALAPADDEGVPGAFGVAPEVGDSQAPEAEQVSARGVDDVATAGSAAIDTAGELTAAGLVKRTPKKRSERPGGADSPAMASRAAGAPHRSPEEVRKMLSRYRSGLNKGRGGTDE